MGGSTGSPSRQIEGEAVTHTLVYMKWHGLVLIELGSIHSIWVGTQDPQNVEEDPRSVEEDPRSVEEDPRSVEEDPKSVEEDPKSVEEDPRSVEEDPRSVEEDPRSVEEDPKRSMFWATISPVGRKICTWQHHCKCCRGQGEVEGICLASGGERRRGTLRPYMLQVRGGVRLFALLYMFKFCNKYYAKTCKYTHTSHFEMKKGYRIGKNRIHCRKISLLKGCHPEIIGVV